MNDNNRGNFQLGVNIEHVEWNLNSAEKSVADVDANKYGEGFEQPRKDGTMQVEKD